MASNLIFLDMDGVVNSESFYDEWTEAHPGASFFNEICLKGGIEGFVSPDLAERFSRLCEATHSIVVWSSSWRMDFEMAGGEFDMDGIRRLWKAKGLPDKRLVGCTPVISGHRMSYVPRFLEIRKWIDVNARAFDINRMAVLDDDYDAWRNDERYDNVVQFQTIWEYGLTEEIADSARRWLNFGECD